MIKLPKQCFKSLSLSFVQIVERALNPRYAHLIIKQPGAIL